MEFAHEISQLPEPPDTLQNDLDVNWRFDTDNAFSTKINGELVPLYFLSDLPEQELKAFDRFESKFKKLMFEGVSVRRVIPTTAGKGNAILEKRNLHLIMPQDGMLRLGFLSESSDWDEKDEYQNDRAYPIVRSSSSRSEISENDSSSESSDVSAPLLTTLSLNFFVC